MTADITTTIKTFLDLCVGEAQRHGWTGEYYSYTDDDLEYVTEELGFSPTRQQWAEAGLPHVGSKHVGP